MNIGRMALFSMLMCALVFGATLTLVYSGINSDTKRKSGVYLIPLATQTSYKLSVNDVVLFGTFISPAPEYWEDFFPKIGINADSKVRNSLPDLRVVIVDKAGNVFGFRSDGQCGVKNGQYVAYDDATKMWFQQFFTPFAEKQIQCFKVRKTGHTDSE